MVAFDFVVFAYKELVNKYYQLLLGDNISQNSRINAPLSEPVVSLLSIDFNPTLIGNYTFFNTKIIRDKKINRATMDIRSYIQEYVSYIPKLRSKTQTHLKFMRAKKTMNHNALTINLLKENLANDQTKIEFMGDPNFIILRKLCEQYGFYINKNVPWQLVANLSHPNIKDIASKLNPNLTIKSVDDIIENYYNILLFIDYEKQKDFFFEAYNKFYEKREYFTESYYCQNKQETKVKIIDRQAPISKENFLKIEELFFLKTYLQILNVESNYKYNNAKIDEIFLNLKSLYSKSLDKKEALVYIHSRFVREGNEQFSPSDF